MRMLVQPARLAICVALAGCADDGSASFGDDLSDPQLPARGSADLPHWLAAGHYQSWHCEAAPHAGRPPSPHGTTRICNNDALHAAMGGAFPVGAASVKEIFNGESISAYAVSLRVTAGPGGDGWYWFEGDASHASGNANGVLGCTGCHEQATRDYVFTVVP
jgi:hypothetical protein